MLRHADCCARRLRQMIRFADHPHQRMGVEKDHRDDSQTSGGSIGDSMSPVILMTPFNRPIRSLLGLSGGTSLARGLPRLVIRTGSRFWHTSSITLKHFALNSPAGSVFMLDISTRSWSL